MGRLRSPLVVALVLVSVAACTRRPDLVRRPETPPAAVLVEDVAVLDVESGASEGHRDVLIEGDRIVRIAAAGEIDVPEGAARIDGRGATLLPGLVDTHVHVSSPPAPPWVSAFPDEDRTLQMFLYSGVTTVLDTGSMAPDAFERRERIARGDQLGPTTYEAGPIVTTTDGHPVAIFRRSMPWYLAWWVLPRMTREVDTPEAARAAAAEIAGMGADVMKVVVDRIPPDAPRIPGDVLAAAIAEARSRDLRSVAHIGSAQDAIDAGEAGVAAWVHGVYKEPLEDAQVETLAGFDVPMAPTLVVFESFAGFGGNDFRPTSLEREMVAPENLDAMNEPPADFDVSMMQSLRAVLPAGRENVRKLHEAGVTILAGSDTQAGVFAGASLHREIALLVEAGLSPAEAIRAATLDPARFLAGRDDPEFGAVAEGKRADLLLVEGDPTEDVANLARIRAVLKSGVPLERRPRGEG